MACEQGRLLGAELTGQAEATVGGAKSGRVAADTLQYVECHGTRTNLGNAVKAEALTQAFSDKNGFCLVGSVKSNIGHLDADAGVVRLIKTTLAPEHGEIPPTSKSGPSPAPSVLAKPNTCSGQIGPID
jgi:acyl transferase domain-containing protein